MTLCNNLSRKRGVGVFSRVGVFLRDYGNQIQSCENWPIIIICPLLGHTYEYDTCEHLSFTEE